ncbi:MAG: FG-GAP-like repeat-containing protein [Nitrospiria bacterium]
MFMKCLVTQNLYVFLRNLGRGFHFLRGIGIRFGIFILIGMTFTIFSGCSGGSVVSPETAGGRVELPETTVSSIGIGQSEPSPPEPIMPVSKDVFLVSEESFDPVSLFKGGEGILRVINVDIDLDGDFDLVTNGKRTNTINIQQNMGSGIFEAVVEYPVVGLVSRASDLSQAAPLSMASGDFNGDGYPDLVSVNSLRDTVSILLNQGNGIYGSPREYSVLEEDLLPVASEAGISIVPLDIKVADFNGDGLDDVVTVNLGNGTVSVLLGFGVSGKGDVVLQPARYFNVGGRPVSISVGDLNGDDFLDLVVANENLESTGFENEPIYYISVLMNIGDGQFSDHIKYQVGKGPGHVITADIDNDGHLDVLTANQLSEPGNISFLRNRGNGVFSAQELLQTDVFPSAIAAVDLDGDGDLDLVSSSPGSIGIIWNQTDINGASFSPPKKLLPGRLFDSAHFITASDYDLDGDQDLLALSRNSDQMALFLNANVANPRARTADRNPDLIVSIIKMRGKGRQMSTRLEVEFSVENIGDEPAVGTFTVLASILRSGISPWTVKFFTGLKPGREHKFKFKKTISGSLEGLTMFLTVDPGDLIQEKNEDNNQAGSFIQ